MSCDREKKVFETEKETSEKEKSAIKEDDKKLSDDLVKLKSARDEIAATLDPDILACYEKILENKGRVALSVISGSSCSECNLQLRAQIINEAKIKKSLVFCENCSRILYAEE